MVPDPFNDEADLPPTPSPASHTTTVASAPDVSPRGDTATTATETARPRGWGHIVETIVSVNAELLFEKLRSELTLTEFDRTSYSGLAPALERADSLYLDACMLARAAKLEEQNVDRECEMRMEVLRTEARRQIETERREQAEAVKSKSLGRATLEEVRDRCIANWPDELRSLERRSQEMHAARAVADELANAWRSRAASLRELVSGFSRGGA